MTYFVATTNARVCGSVLCVCAYVYVGVRAGVCGVLAQPHALALTAGATTIGWRPGKGVGMLSHAGRPGRR